MSLTDSNANRCANTEALNAYMKKEDKRQRVEDEYRAALEKAEAEIIADDGLLLDALNDLSDLMGYATMTDAQIEEQASRHPHLSSVEGVKHKRDVAHAALVEFRRILLGREVPKPSGILGALRMTSQYAIEARADDIVEAAHQDDDASWDA